MMIVKKRKLLALLPQEGWDGSLFFKALRLTDIQYTLKTIDPDLGVLVESVALATAKGWDPDNCVAIPVKVKDANVRIVFVTNVNLDTLIQAVIRIANIKAFL